MGVLDSWVRECVGWCVVSHPRSFHLPITCRQGAGRQSGVRGRFCCSSSHQKERRAVFDTKEDFQGRSILTYGSCLITSHAASPPPCGVDERVDERAQSASASSSSMRDMDRARRLHQQRDGGWLGEKSKANSNYLTVLPDLMARLAAGGHRTFLPTTKTSTLFPSHTLTTTITAITTTLRKCSIWFLASQNLPSVSLPYATNPAMPSPRAIENVWSYPRPPALQPTPARLRVVWRYPSGQERTIAETRKGYRVLETSHPPTYYFPREDVRGGSLQESSARSTYCEWKGRAKYWDLVGDGDESGAQTLLTKGRIWSYPDPTPGFRSIKVREERMQ